MSCNNIRLADNVLSIANIPEWDAKSLQVTTPNLFRLPQVFSVVH